MNYGELDELRSELGKEIVRDGSGCCPVCDTTFKIDRRAISKDACLSLIDLVKHFEAEPGWYNVRDLRTSASRELFRLAKWGLLESPLSNRGRIMRGWWRPTQEGIDFAHGNSKIPKWVRTFQGRVCGYSDDELITIMHMVPGYDHDELFSQPPSDDTISGYIDADFVAVRSDDVIEGEILEVKIANACKADS